MGDRHVTLLAEIDELIAAKHLLKHPFYQAWTAGELTLECLRGYSGQYFRQVEAFPQYLGAVYARCPDIALRRQILRNLIEEDWGEDNHPELWLRFAEGLGIDRQQLQQTPPLEETERSVAMMREATAEGHAAAGMAAIYAYEAMVPEVSQSKIEGLKRFYGIDDARTLSFFTVHESADREHREWDRELIGALCGDDDGRAETCKRAAAKTLDALWLLLDGVQRRFVAQA